MRPFLIFSPPNSVSARSFVCDPAGVVLAEAGDRDEVLVVQCDLGKIEETRRGWPFLRDRRIDAFDGLTRRWIGQEEH
jgi:N-carbamoylputrescine amidase